MELAVAKMQAATNNQRGFTLLESTLSLPILFSALACVLSVVYLCFAQAWLKDSAEEAALCVAERVNARTCKAELEKKTATTLPIGKYSHLSVELIGDKVAVRYVYEALKITLENEVTLRLPVTKGVVGL